MSGLGDAREPSADEVRRYGQLMGSVVFFVLTHALGLVTMLLLLQPGVDAGRGLHERALFVREHSTGWVVGWLPWQLSALSDLLVSIALLRYLRALPGRPGHAAAWLALVFNVLAVVPEQYAELQLVTTFVRSTRELEGAALTAYMSDASRLFMVLTGTVANTFYTVMLGGWMVARSAVARASGMPRGTRPLEVVLLVLFLLAGVATYVTYSVPAEHAARWFLLGTAVNGLAFPGLLAFSVFWAADLGDAHHARFAHPLEGTWTLCWPGASGGAWARLAERCGSAGMRDLLRVLTRRLPYPVLRSQVEQVVYLNWMVPVERARALLPASITLDAFDGLTPLSVLTYRHGHFGPAFLGPLRRLLPSPIQSNWRLYLAPKPPTAPNAIRPPQDAVAFVSTGMDHTLYALGSRLMSDGLPSHRLAEGSCHEGLTDDVGVTRITTRLLAGGGSAADLHSVVRVETAAALEVPAAFRALGDTRAALAYLVEQNRAVRAHRALGLWSESHLAIPIPLDSVLAAQVEQLDSAWLAPLVDGCTAWAFVVPSVAFASLGETLHPLPRAHA